MKKIALIVFSFLCIISGYTYSQKVETGIITDRSIIFLTGENSGNQYLKAKTELLSTLSTGIAINVSGLLTKLEVTTGNMDTKKQILQSIVNIIVEKVTETGGKQNGAISKNDMDNIIMPNICIIAISYNIPSETCSTWNDNRNPGLEETTDTRRLILIPIIVLLIIGGIWYRIIKRSDRTQGCIFFSGLIFLLTFIFMGLDYSDINFGGILYFIGWISGGVALVFIGLVLFFIYKKRQQKKVLDMINDSEGYFNKGEYEQALKICNELISIYENKTREYSKDETYKKILNYKKNLEKCTEEFNKNKIKQKIKDMINDSEKYYINGEDEQALKIYNELILMYEKAIPNYNNDETYKIILNCQKDLEKHISLKKDLGVNKDDKDSFIKEGEFLFSLGKNEKAINTYKEAIELFKNEKIFYAILGGHFITLGKNDDAIEILNKAIEIDKEFKEAYLNKSVALIALGKYDEALEVYNTIIEIDKSYTEGYIRAQAILVELGRYQEALNISNKALDNDIQDIRVYQNKGIILSRLKRYEEAIENYNKALEINPLDENVLINKSTDLISSGKYEDALEYLNFILTKINPLCINAHINKGIALKHLEKYDEAFKKYDDAININKNNTDIYINRACIYQKLQKYEEALKDCNEAIRINKDNHYAYYCKACIYSQMNNTKEAIENLIKAIKMNSKYKEIFKAEEDFDNIRNLDEFKKTIG